MKPCAVGWSATSLLPVVPARPTVLLTTDIHLPLRTVRDWEQGAHRPDKAAQVLLTVIAKDPDAVARALEG